MYLIVDNILCGNEKARAAHAGIVLSDIELC
jgi:hypothetical protein